MIEFGQNDQKDIGKQNSLTIRQAMDDTGDLLDKILKNAPKPIKDMTTHLSQARGKGVRTLLLLTCSADDNGLVPKYAVNASAAIELFHMATLVHDDIIDDADLRRGIKTVHSKFGDKNAVICGDYLLVLAMSAITPLFEAYYSEPNSKLFEAFTKSLSRTCLGELNEHLNNRNLDLSILQYLRIISGKTSSLFYVAAYAGALIGNCEKSETQTLAKFGRNLGMIFQIVDDCKDFEFSVEQAQKPVNNDIVEGVVTLPLIFAIQKEPALKELAKNAFESIAHAKLLHSKVSAVGGLEASKAMSAKYYNKSLGILNKIKSQIKRENLLDILQKTNGASTVF